MTFSRTPKLLILSVTVGVLLVAIVWHRTVAWRQLSDIENLISAEHIELLVWEFTDSLWDYYREMSDENMQVINDVKAELEDYADDGDGSWVTNDLEAELSRQLETFMGLSRKVPPSQFGVRKPQEIEDFLRELDSEVERTSLQCRKVISEFKKVRQLVWRFEDDIGSLNDQSRMKIKSIKLHAVSSWFFAVGGGCLIAVLVYQAMILPRNQRLAQNRALLERHEKLASLSILAAGFAHEIRNPLNSISARLFTQKRLLAAQSEECQDNVFISGEISRLNQIIEGFLGFARPGDPELSVVPASEPVKKIVDLLRPELEKANIQLETDFRDDPFIEVDVQQIKQVLLNLAKNAAEAIVKDGTITFRAYCQGSLGSDGRVAVLEVEDNGPGISPEAEDRLFDPFYTTKDNGTGLGLSISERIVEKQKGRLEYKTEVNMGTTFGIVLPVASTVSQQ